VNWEEVEARLGVALPSDYKRYLDARDDFFLDCSRSVEAEEPTPFGDAVIDEFVPPNKIEVIDEKLVLVAQNSFGYPTYMSVHPSDYGYIYYYDFQQRTLQPDEWFYRQFPNLDPGIKEYLEMRSNGLLPEKPSGNESLYRLARSFSDFVAKMVNLDD
jgi:hypothetical protein